MNLTVDELQQQDIEDLVTYWTKSDDAHMKRMGVEISKLPGAEQWREILAKQLAQSYTEKQSFCTIWKLNGRSIGHSNVNMITFGREAFIHLHIWQEADRRKGYGQLLLPQSIRLFFERLELKNIYCEPAASNDPPNKTLQLSGFQLEKTYTTVPGFICFEHPVNRWVLSKERFLSKFNSR